MSMSSSMRKIHFIIKMNLSLCSSHHPPTDCKKKADLRQLHLEKLENVWTFFWRGGKARFWVNTRTLFQKSESIRWKITEKVLFQTVEIELLNKFDSEGFTLYALSPPSLLVITSYLQTVNWKKVHICAG